MLPVECFDAYGNRWHPPSPKACDLEGAKASMRRRCGDHLLSLVVENRGTTEHTEYTETRHNRTRILSVCSVCSVVKKRPNPEITASGRLAWVRKIFVFADIALRDFWGAAGGL